MNATIPHGTICGYNYHRCRCRACKDAKNAYARQHGYNKRVGKRRAQKAAHDHKPCPKCGAPMRHDSTQCADCWREQQLATRRDAGASQHLRPLPLRRRHIPPPLAADLRRAGYTWRQIGEITGSTESNLRLMAEAVSR